MWDLSSPTRGTKDQARSSLSEGGFLTTGPPGKSPEWSYSSLSDLFSFAQPHSRPTTHVSEMSEKEFGFPWV